MKRLLKIILNFIDLIPISIFYGIVLLVGYAILIKGWLYETDTSYTRESLKEIFVDYKTFWKTLFK